MGVVGSVRKASFWLARPVRSVGHDPRRPAHLVDRRHRDLVEGVVRRAAHDLRRAGRVRPVHPRHRRDVIGVRRAVVADLHGRASPRVVKRAVDLVGRRVDPVGNDRGAVAARAPRDGAHGLVARLLLRTHAHVQAPLVVEGVARTYVVLRPRREEVEVVKGAHVSGGGRVHERRLVRRRRHETAVIEIGGVAERRDQPPGTRAVAARRGDRGDEPRAGQRERVGTGADERGLVGVGSVPSEPVEAERQPELALNPHVGEQAPRVQAQVGGAEAPAHGPRAVVGRAVAEVEAGDGVAALAREAVVLARLERAVAHVTDADLGRVGRRWRRRCRVLRVGLGHRCGKDQRNEGAARGDDRIPGRTVTGFHDCPRQGRQRWNFVPAG